MTGQVIRFRFAANPTPAFAPKALRRGLAVALAEAETERAGEAARKMPARTRYDAGNPAPTALFRTSTRVNPQNFPTVCAAACRHSSDSRYKRSARFMRSARYLIERRLS